MYTYNIYICMYVVAHTHTLFALVSYGIILFIQTELVHQSGVYYHNFTTDTLGDHLQHMNFSLVFILH